MARKSSAERAKQMAGGFATAGKNIVIQFQNREIKQTELLEQIRTDVLKRGIPDEEIESVDVYIKPEEHKAFYVVNGEIEGSIDC